MGGAERMPCLGNVPSSIRTLHLAQVNRPPQMLSISTPAARGFPVGFAGFGGSPSPGRHENYLIWIAAHRHPVTTFAVECARRGHSINSG